MAELSVVWVAVTVPILYSRSFVFRSFVQLSFCREKTLTMEVYIQHYTYNPSAKYWDKVIKKWNENHKIYLTPFLRK